MDNKVAPQEVDFDILSDVICQGIPLGLRNIKITGGEPFLSRDMFRLIGLAFKKGLSVFLETNGTLVTDSEAEVLKNNKVAQVAVSLDGSNKEVHEWLRGVKGCFNKTIRGIKALKKHGLNVQVIISAFKGNIDDIEATIGFIETLGVDSVKINCISIVGRGKIFDNKGLNVGVEDFIELSKKVYNGSWRKFRLPVTVDIPPAFLPLSRIRTDNSRCSIKNILGVLSDGRISICGIGENMSALVLGDIRRESLEDIWTGNELLKDIREDIPRKLKGVCGRCILKMRCLGKCRAEAYYNSGDMLSSFSFCNEAYKLGLFPADRLY